VVHGGGARAKGDAGGGPIRQALASGVGSVAIMRRRRSSGWHRQGKTETGVSDRRWDVQRGGTWVTWSLCGRTSHRLASRLEHLLGDNRGSRDGRPGGLEARWCSTGQSSVASGGE
jgi:hypothetical protein